MGCCVDDSNTTGQNALLRAAANPNIQIDIFKLLIDNSKLDVNYTDRRGENLLAKYMRNNFHSIDEQIV